MLRRMTLLLAALGLAAACAAPDQGMTDGGDEGGEGTLADVPLAEGSGHDGGDLAGDGAAPSWKRPTGSAAIRFMVDDTATGTYKDGQMKWTGSFRWSAQDNTIEWSAAWQPTDGPFPPLYDDGPWSEGGHEPEGATKGDHRFECEVWFVAEEDTTFEYGVLNEVDRWIWIGPNGTVEVPAGSTDDIVAAPLVLPAFGDIDFELTLDISQLDPAFASISPPDYSIFVKTSANSWFPVQLLDDGQKGDAAEGDGIYTYRQSENLGEHDGLLADGRHVQFVFVFAMADMSPDDGSEYKVGTVCPLAGVAARSDRGSPGTFHEEDVVLERDSRGKVFNTTIILGDGGPWCLADADCYTPPGAAQTECDEEAKACKDTSPPVLSDPSIALIDPNKGPIAGGTEVTITGSDFREGCEVDFGGVPAVSATLAGPTEVKAVTPPHAAGIVTITLTNPDGQVATCPNCFEFVEPVAPKLPDWGRLDEPTHASTWVGVETKPLYAEVYAKDVTTGGSSGEPLLRAEVGTGPLGSEPADPGTGWVWTPASYDHSTGTGDNNAVYTATVTPTASGARAFTFRFSLDGGASWLYVDSDGASAGGADFSSAALGRLDVAELPNGPLVLGVEPTWGPTAGGTTVRVKGLGFQSGAKVLFDGAEVESTWIDEGTIEVVIPGHATGRVDVTVRNPDAVEGALDDAFAFVPFGTPVAGGTWDPAWRVAQNAVVSDWNPPGEHKNELLELYVAVDDVALHVGVKGFCEPTNAIVGWVDLDPGAGTGFAPGELLDAAGALDNAISAPSVTVTADSFGAEAAFGSVGMNATEGMTAAAGWRGFVGADVGPSNFAWLPGPLTVAPDGTSLVASIELATLYGGSVPARADIALFARIVSADGNATANQCLPEQPQGLAPGEVSKVVVVPLR